jgi:Ca2+-dependent lipid-binding protein
VLTVEILDANLERDTALMMKMDPYTHLKLGNVMHSTKIIKDGGTTPVFNEKFTWFINSDKISDNRRLEVTVWDKNKASDSEVGFGIVDLDPVILNHLTNLHQKCYLSYKRGSAGAVNLKLSFN